MVFEVVCRGEQIAIISLRSSPQLYGDLFIFFTSDCKFTN